MSFSKLITVSKCREDAGGDDKGLAFKKTSHASDCCCSWCGAAPSPAALKVQLGLDAVFYMDETAAVIASYGITLLHVLKGQNQDSKCWSVTTTPTDLFVRVPSVMVDDSSRLYDALVECRVIKSDLELVLLRHLNLLSSKGNTSFRTTQGVVRMD